MMNIAGRSIIGTETHVVGSVVKRLFTSGRSAGTVPLVSARSDLRNHRYVKQCYTQMAEGRRDIESVAPDPIVAQRLVDRVIGQWRKLGAAEPYFSNENRDEFKSGKIDGAAIDRFYKEGDAWMRTLAAFESRSQVKIADGLCVELGAGVGRSTHALARRFERVIAIDVSEPLLEVNAARLKALGVTNVTTHALRGTGDLGGFGPIDFFLAQGVLLHNPAPIQKMLLDTALTALKPGAFAWFNTPDWLENYTFSTKAFVENPPDIAADCHCLPKVDVLDILRRHGMTLLDFYDDFLTESYGSIIYFARKDAT